MPTSRAIVPTTRAARYLAQLCSHTGHVGSGLLHRRAHGSDESRALVSETDTGGTDKGTSTGTSTTGRIKLGAARCDLTADAAGLTLVVTADDPEQLRALQTAVTRTLERIGRRDGLAVVWEAVV
ncbi:MAG: DUF2218 domain-containing protein [Catenulispora sp.]|nr:DUF2218 domain-containing protein [Catenulispora sp.]